MLEQIEELTVSSVWQEYLQTPPSFSQSDKLEVLSSHIPDEQQVSPDLKSLDEVGVPEQT